MAPRNPLLTYASVLVLLGACAGDDPPSSETSDGTSEGDDDDGETSTTEDTSATPMTSSTTTTDPGTTESGESSSSTGPTIGCTPGDPCCNDAGMFEECWIDDRTGLVWELVPGGGNPTAAEALAYCDQLTLLDSGGWRLPNIDELRTLVTACDATRPDGSCGLTTKCFEQDCRDDTCDACDDAPNAGPGLAGCYWNPNLNGGCDRYWSSTNFDGLGWLLDFNDASIRQADAGLPAGLVRCVAN